MNEAVREFRKKVGAILCPQTVRENGAVDIMVRPQRLAAYLHCSEYAHAKIAKGAGTIDPLKFIDWVMPTMQGASAGKSGAVIKSLYERNVSRPMAAGLPCGSAVVAVAHTKTPGAQTVGAWSSRRRLACSLRDGGGGIWSG